MVRTIVLGVLLQPPQRHVVGRATAHRQNRLVGWSMFPREGTVEAQKEPGSDFWGAKTSGNRLRGTRTEGESGQSHGPALGRGQAEAGGRSLEFRSQLCLPLTWALTGPP